MTGAVALAFIAVGALMCVDALRALRRVRRFRAHAARATGVVIDRRWASSAHSSRRTWKAYPVTDFTTADGEAVEAVSHWGQLVPPGIGSEVTVLYDPADPKVVGVDGRLRAETEPGLRFLGGLAAMAFGLVVALDPSFNPLDVLTGATTLARIAN
jgi:hypothetical protein